jgi:hypothetical protein
MGQRFKSACTHIKVRTPGPSAINRPRELLLPLPARYPHRCSERIQASTHAHLYRYVQHVVVDLEKPRSLRATIG